MVRGVCLWLIPSLPYNNGIGAITIYYFVERFLSGASIYKISERFKGIIYPFYLYLLFGLINYFFIFIILSSMSSARAIDSEYVGRSLFVLAIIWFPSLFLSAIAVLLYNFHRRRG